MAMAGMVTEVTPGMATVIISHIMVDITADIMVNSILC